ncbi:MAG: Crp/Fnr family transcriptional regulator [Pyrinomonadaceae bacterium]
MPEIESNNAILSALPPEIFEQILPKLEPVELIYNSDIYAAGDVIEHVYFPESGIISLLAVVGKDSSIEVGIVGDEGMIGIPLFLGETRTNNRAVVQGSGVAMRMTATDFLFESTPGELQRILKKYTHSLMTQISQSAACNRFHPIEARLARWLLMTRDRMRSDEFRITQEFLSNMIGVRREAVSRAASDLQHRGLVHYVRGRLSILDPKKLESLACTCYAILSEPPA